MCNLLLIGVVYRSGLVVDTMRQEAHRRMITGKFLDQQTSKQMTFNIKFVPATFLFQEISITRHEVDSGAKSPRSFSPKSPQKCNISYTSELQGSARQSFSDYMQQRQEQQFFPPVLMVSDLPSSPAVHQFEKSLNPDASYLGGQIIPASSDCLSVSPSTKHKSGFVHQGTPIIKKHTTSLVSGNPGLLAASSPQSPKSRTFSETGSDWGIRIGQQGKPQSSPSSPSLMLKHFKLFSTSGFDSSKRRGSEPILESHGGNDFKKVQLGVTDRRWEKLRSILVAMKDEPVDMDNMLGTDPTNCLENIQDKISMQEEMTCLSKEVADLNVILRQKEEVIEVTSHLLGEVTSQRVYLQRLMALVLTHVPRLLDEVDGLYSTSGDGEYDDDDEEEVEDDSCFVNNEIEDEVWC
ncbi:hypothetical protein ElyMa_000210400 [Elysia marginata]|uniref:Uncharacterized protein n=1 Tax=Elysia marginata TaxID=1093978 RepID=A0AAV4EZR4_9GAST|nr:hypothetical protein ElyMa_000210400 [Elysia marginata]